VQLGYSILTLESHGSHGGREYGKASLIAKSVIVHFNLVSVCLFLEVMTVELSYPSVPLRFCGSEEAVAEAEGLCLPYLSVLVPSWEHCTFADTTTF
jgi:hypothetical protein